jgi:putative endopeptidase
VPGTAAGAPDTSAAANIGADGMALGADGMALGADGMALGGDIGGELDASVRPQDDFFRHVNGRWSAGFDLPDGSAEASTLSLLEDEVGRDVADMIRRIATEPASRGAAAGRRANPTDRVIADLYASFMDEHRIEERGVTELAADVREILAASDRRALAMLMGRHQAQGIGGAFEPSVAIDPAQPDRAGACAHMLDLGQSGLGLPAPALYDHPGAVDLRERYTRHVTAMLAFAGVADPAGAAARVVRAETGLAAEHTSPGNAAAGFATGRGSPNVLADLTARDHGFPWGAWIAGFAALPPATKVRVRPEPFLTGVESWWSRTDLEALRLWYAWRYVHDMAPFTPRRVFAEHFGFYWRDLAGARRPWPRWVRAAAFVRTQVGEAVGERYLREYVGADTLAAARDLVGALVRTYRDCLRRARWMRADTRDAALAKLDAMRFEIGGPHATAAHLGPSARSAPRGDLGTGLRTDPADLLGNVKRARARRVACRLERLRGPADRSDWQVLPQAVTAYYRHGLNQVVIPAGLLRPPAFDPGDPARAFAVLGSIVCHEMTHAFDRRGSHHGRYGGRRAWWASADRAEFARRATPLIAQYGGYRPRGLDGRAVDGTRTLGENIADITGLSVAQRAFGEHLRARGLTPETAAYRREVRRFFVSWASMWRAKRTRERALQRLANDPHAPPEFRCNGAAGHVPAFYDAFGVTENDRMYIRPEDRFTLLD